MDEGSEDQRVINLTDEIDTEQIQGEEVYEHCKEEEE
jgi:hypothetical protein